MTALKALIFDLGNVLVFHDNQKLFAALGSLFGTEAQALAAKVDASVWDRVNKGLLPGDSLRQELCRSLGKEVSRQGFEEAWSCHFWNHEAMIERVESLVGRYRLVLLSNTHDLHIAHIRPKLPLLKRFDALVLSYEVGLAKPDAAIYRAAVAKAAVEPDACLFFDDVKTYVDAARATGLPAHVFTTVEQFNLDLGARTSGPLRKT